jgi:hypothetical protein
MDDTFSGLGVKLDMEKKSLALTRNDDPSWSATFTFERPSPDRMVLDGEMGGRKAGMGLELVPLEKFLLVSHGFAWILDRPFNW